MRRRRRSKTTGVPPPPAPKEATPKRHELKEIYGKLVTANKSQRINAFMEAWTWWSAATKYYLDKQPLKSDQIKRFAQANKSWNLALGAGTDSEKEAAALRAIALLEKTFDSQKIISYKPYYKQYEEKKAILEKKEASAAARFGVVLEALNSAFKPMNREFQLVKELDGNKLEQYDGQGKILLTINLAKAINEKIKSDGFLPVLLGSAFTVIKTAGIENVSDNDAPGGIKTVVNFKKMMESIPTAHESILKYIASVPRGKIFKQFSGVVDTTPIASSSNGNTPKVRIPKVAGTSGPKVARQPRASSSGSLIAGRYQDGTACAVLYKKLEDQKPHALSDILSGIPAGNPADRLRYLQKHGARNGKWTVVVHNNVIQMTIH